MWRKAQNRRKHLDPRSSEFSSFGTGMRHSQSTAGAGAHFIVGSLQVIGDAARQLADIIISSKRFSSLTWAAVGEALTLEYGP